MAEIIPPKVEPIIPKVEPKIEKVETKSTKKYNKMDMVSPEVATNILKDKYHENLTSMELREKYKINKKTCDYIIKTFSDKFIEKFGKYKEPISLETLEEYWKVK